MPGPFELAPIFIGFVFLLIVSTIAVNAFKGFAEWSRNNAMPKEAVPARVVTKRSETSVHMNRNTRGRSMTHYFVTFEMKSGERREFGLDGPEFGLIAEGDEGTLVHQGTRFLGFGRNNDPRSLV